MRKVYIYGLVDPATDAVRYVGRAYDPPTRLRHHLAPSHLRGHSHKERWLRKLLANGRQPGLLILEVCDETTYREREEHWTGVLPNLTNQKPGGVGGNGGATKGRKLAAEHRAKIGAAHRGRPKPQSFIDAQKASWATGHRTNAAAVTARRGAKASPETRAKISAAQRGRVNSSKSNEKRSLALRGRSPWGVRPCGGCGGSWDSATPGCRRCADRHRKRARREVSVGR